MNFLTVFLCSISLVSVFLWPKRLVRGAHVELPFSGSEHVFALFRERCLGWSSRKRWEHLEIDEFGDAGILGYIAWTGM